MRKDVYDCIVRRIREIIEASPVEEDPLHAENTLEWVRRLGGSVDSALEIAALGHDIERATPGKVRREEFPHYDDFKRAHSRRSAAILREIMEECGASREDVQDVVRMVERHEFGGDPRSDLLKDADALSFFQVNLPLYFRRNGPEEARRRFIWGYRRLSPERRELVRSFDYDEELQNHVARWLEEAERKVIP